MARPKKVIDAKLVEGLAAVGCTVEEMATLLECSKRTLERSFDAVIEKGRDGMKMSLRRKQVELAKAGNVTMLVWLGKQYLDQSDKAENKTQVSGAYFGYRDADDCVPPVPAEATHGPIDGTE